MKYIWDTCSDHTRLAHSDHRYYRYAVFLWHVPTRNRAKGLVCLPHAIYEDDAPAPNRLSYQPPARRKAKNYRSCERGGGGFKSSETPRIKIKKLQIPIGIASSTASWILSQT